MGAAVAVGHLVAGIVEPNASPVVAVGNATIEVAPPWLERFAVDTFGKSDKLVLAIGTGIVLLAVAVIAGLLSRREPWPGMVFALLLGGLAMIAVLTRPDLGLLAFIAPLASLAAGVLGFRWLHGAALRGTATPAADGLSRRRFLRTSGGVAAAVGAAGAGGWLLADRVDSEGSRAAVGSLTPSAPPPPTPAGVDFAGRGTPTFITSNKDFYRIDTAYSVPRLLAEEWQLRIHGMVDRERTYTFDDIRRRVLVERPITMACVSNEVGGPYISTARFLGVPIRELLNETGVRPGADQVLSTSSDGFTAGSPTEALLDPRRDALLAIGMNGEPLPIEHGFPARIVVPGLYGYVSATKWVVDIELTTFAAKQGYWIPRGWSVRAPVKTQSRIDAPRDGASVPAGEVTVAGIAWAPTIGIAKVEVRLDGGAWQPAELAAEVNDQTWRMWLARVPVPRGGHKVEVRATDRSGYTQTETRTEVAPDGATGWHAINFSAR
ncbi:molybdopterin-dependent oxidoreductase [Herbihabitans rhizosphaerae]|nr:molybdopterin-dependent oxidoreductase [Herbihabitans rhizosphaerae]